MTTQEKITYPYIHSILTQTLKVKNLWLWQTRKKKQSILPFHRECHICHISRFKVMAAEHYALIFNYSESLLCC